MALHPDHPAAIRRRKHNKGEHLRKLYDLNRYSESACKTSGCATCHYWSECASNLWRRTTTADGITYVPLRCFAEHPEYNPEEWRTRGERELTTPPLNPQVGE